MQPMTPGKPPFSEKPCFTSCLSVAVDGHRMNWFCFQVRAVETLLTILETVYFGMPPTVSPTNSKKLQLAKKTNGNKNLFLRFQSIVSFGWPFEIRSERVGKILN